ncbi:SHF protein, partial [Sclerurus mexicanus]|nr:SHF protein [Sclerurus mexicanus]
GRRGRSRRGPQLYDTPSEEWEAAGGGPGVPPARDSRLPRHDERPADEYDQPWEWKKDHISRAFAAPLGTTMGVPPAPMGTSPTPKHPPVLTGTTPGSPQSCTPQFPWVPSLAPSILRHPWVPPCGPPVHRGVTPAPPSSPDPMGVTPGPSWPQHVDTSLPLEKQAWYHGPIGRAGAETLLALCREGSFLVRDCETSPDDYSLSLRSSHGFVHVKLTRTREQHFTLGRAGAAFPSVPAAVRHYTARALPVRGARHLALLYPVAVQPL